MRARPLTRNRALIHSMTAFARTESVSEFGDLSLELRSVNHRYLETVFRLPEELRRYEPRYRELIGKRFSRGRIDINMRFKPVEATTDDARLNLDGVARLATMAAQVREQIPEIGALRTIDVLGWPGIVSTPALEMEKLGAQAETLFLSALDEMAERRAREGEGTAALISSRLDDMRAIVTGLRPVIPEFEQHFRERMNERLATVKEDLDPARVEQEIVLFLQKSDVAEELDRLELHFTEMARALKDSKPVGRRLDFLMQELNREANTLGSKAADPRVTNASVDLKVLIEQCREQVQNIE